MGHTYGEHLSILLFLPPRFGTKIERKPSVKVLSKIALLVLLLAATSCASRKKTVAPIPPQSFEWLTANMDIQAEGNGMNFDDLSGQLRMRKDSLVWLSVTATLGVEVLRAKVSTDSVWIVNRIEKTYLAEPMKNLSETLGIPLSLALLQTLLLDNNELDEKTSFPLKISDKMERIQIKPIQ